MKKRIEINEPIYGEGSCANHGGGAPVQYHGTFEIDTDTKSINPVSTWDYADGRTCYWCAGHVSGVSVDLSAVIK
jgi:hypothetical protein